MPQYRRAAARGLFHQVIVQSGPCAFDWPSIDQKYTVEADLPARLGCSGTAAAVATCLRSANLSVRQLLAVQNATPAAVLFPSVGGRVVPVQPRTAIGQFPMLIGPNGNWALNTVESDFGRTPKGVYIAVCTNVRTFELGRSANSRAIYAYEFNDPDTPPSQRATQGPVHPAELQYLIPAAALPGASKGLSDTMVLLGKLHSFRKPEPLGLPTWPSYTRSIDVMQLVAGAVATGKDVNANHKRPFWNGLGFALQAQRFRGGDSA